MKTWISTEPESTVHGGDGFSQAAPRITEIGEKAAAAMDSAASSLRSKAETLPGGEKVSTVAYASADVMEKTAGYVRDRDLRGILSDAQQIAKKHPGATLLTAAALGFLLARSIFRH